MKRTIFLKALAVFMIMATLTANLPCAFAAVSAVQEGLSRNVTVTGSIDGAPENSNVALLVTKKGVTEEQIKSWEQTGSEWKKDMFVSAD